MLTRSGITELRDKNGQIVKSDKEMAEVLWAQYHDTFTKDVSNLPMIPDKKITTEPLFNSIIVQEDVAKILRSLKVDKLQA